MNTRAHWLAQLLLRHPSRLALLVVVAVVAGLASIPQIRFVAGIDIYFDRDSPLQGELDAIHDRFINDELLFVVYQSNDVFDQKSLETIRGLGQTLEGVLVPTSSTNKADTNAETRPYAFEDVLSVASVDDLVGGDFSFRSEALVPESIPGDSQALELIRNRAKANPVIAKNLLGRNQGTATMVLRLGSELSEEQTAHAVGIVRKALNEARSANTDMTFHLVGRPVTDRDMVSYQQEDLGRFIPVVYLLMATILFVFLRSIRGVVIALTAVGVSLGAATAALLLITNGFNNTSVMIPPLMMALTVAMCIHYFTEYGHYGQSDSAQAAPVRTLTALLGPVWMASITTAVGFASLRVSTIPAIKEFGTIAAIAMILATLLTTAIAALCFGRWTPAHLISPKGFGLSPKLGSILQSITRLVTGYPRQVFAVSVLVTIFLGIGVTRIVVDQNDLLFFHEETPLRQGNTMMEANIGGSSVMVAAIGTSKDGNFSNPTELAKIQKLETFLTDELGADMVVSIVDFIKLIHREFFDGDPAEFRLPDTSEQVAQLLLMNTDDTVDEYLDESRTWVRIVARTPEHSSARLVNLYERLDAYLAREFPHSEGYTVHAAANSRLTASIFNDLTRSQVASVGVSSIIILALMFLMLRSLFLGLHSIAPNMFPILVNLGLMGWFGIELNAATVMIATVALGIAVDDTVHFLQYLRVRLAEHNDVQQAIVETIRTKGPAIMGTSLVLSTGFAVLMLSNFVPTRDFGLLMCITMLAALVGDLILLPSFLLVLRRK